MSFASRPVTGAGAGGGTGTGTCAAPRRRGQSDGQGSSSDSVKLRKNISPGPPDRFQAQLVATLSQHDYGSQSYAYAPRTQVKCLFAYAPRKQEPMLAVAGPSDTPKNGNRFYPIEGIGTQTPWSHKITPRAPIWDSPGPARPPAAVLQPLASCLQAASAGCAKR